MPPVEVLNDKGPATKLRFVRNTTYNGQDYGPDHDSDTAEVDSHWAPIFLGNGRAVEAGPVTGKPAHRDPEAEHRDPEVAPSEKKK
jgi:hypothetical protein